MKKILITLFTLTLLLACKPKEEVPVKDSTDSEPVTKETKVTQQFCTKDLKICPDGSGVGRNSKNNCKFHDCPKTDSKNSNPKDTKTVMCTKDAKECPDGSWVGRDSKNHCKFKQCPTGNGNPVE